MAVIQGGRGTGNVLAARLVIDMEDTAYELDKNVTPLLTMTTALKMVEDAHNPKYSWREFTPLSREAIVEGSQTSGDTAIEVEAGQGVRFLQDDLVFVPSTGEIFSVTSVATDTLTVVRSWGATAAAAMVDTDPLIILGQAKPEGSDLPAARSEEETEEFNYTQIFREPIDITETMLHTDVYGEKERGKERRRAQATLKKDLERAFIWGQRELVTASNGHPRRSTRGFYEFVSGNPAESSPSWSVISYNSFVSIGMEVFRFPNAYEGGRTKVIMGGPQFVAAIQRAWEGQIQVQTGETEYGLKVHKVISEFGDFDLMVHPLMVGAYSKRAMVVDPRLIKRRPLQGRDIKLAVDVHDPGYDGIRDEYITEQGFQLMNPRAHGDITYTGS